MRMFQLGRGKKKVSPRVVRFADLFETRGRKKVCGRER